jgi:hypothetical protein
MLATNKTAPSERDISLNPGKRARPKIRHERSLIDTIDHV